MGLALGFLGMTEQQFWETRLKPFFLQLKYAEEKHQESIRMNSEMIRFQTMKLLNIQLISKDRYKTLDELWELPWDEQPDTGIYKEDPEKAKEHNRQLLNHLKNG